jgi:hypothetical protein
VWCAPVTLTTGVCPRRPRFCLWAGVSPDQIHPRRSARRPGPPPSFYHRPALLPPRGDPGPIPLRGAAGRDLHAPPGPVQQQAHPGEGAAHLEPAPDHFSHPGQRPVLILISPRRGRASVQHRLQLTQLAGGEPAPRAPPPRDASAARPPAASARRHRFAGIRDTPNRRATSRSLAPSSISPAAANRTCSHRARSPASSPPPSGYLMPLRYRSPQRPSAELITQPLKIVRRPGQIGR